jgi:hypothetical protein
MWSGFDPEIVRGLQAIRQLVRLTHQTPTREWPLFVVEQSDEVFVVREWPDGSVTAYTMSCKGSSRP